MTSLTLTQFDPTRSESVSTLHWIISTLDLVPGGKVTIGADRQPLSGIRVGRIDFPATTPSLRAAARYAEHLSNYHDAVALSFTIGNVYCDYHECMVITVTGIVVIAPDTGLDEGLAHEHAA